MEDYIEEGFEYESSDIVSPTPTPTPDILQSEESLDDSEIIEEDSFSYPSDVSGELSQSGDIEEGIEVGEEEPAEEPAETPDEIESQEIVQNDEVSGAGQVRSETPTVDYSVQLAQIYEELQTIEGNINYDDINENLISIDSNMELVHRDLVAMDRNNKFHSRLEIGLLVAIWGSLIIYIAFSKIF